MKTIIMAPLRGFTDVVFRNAFQHHFRGVNEAVAPFVTSIKGRRIKPSHLRDLAPTENRTMPVVPQILSNNSDEFICLANTLFDLGYGEINWNLGCPYPMVAKKKRGSGLLPHPESIDRMLDALLNGIAGTLSIKTRLGRWSVNEMDQLIPVFNRYPLARIIVHPRTGAQMYTGSVDVEAYASCLARIQHPVVYNGDINEMAMLQKLEARFPETCGWMLGRGLIANPFLPEMIQSGTLWVDRPKERFARFHEDLLEGYRCRFSGPAHVLDRMKGFWRYFSNGFANGRKILKQIRKTSDLKRYRQFVSAVLDGQNRWTAMPSGPEVG